MSIYLSAITSIKLDLDQEEASNIAFDTKHLILETAKRHWIHHFEKGTPEEFAAYVLKQEQYRFKRMKLLFEITGLSHVIPEVERELKEIWKSKPKKQEA